MEASEIRQRLLEVHGIRIGEEMGRYVVRQLESAATSIPIMGGDARTGRPVRRIIDVRELMSVKTSGADSEVGSERR